MFYRLSVEALVIFQRTIFWRVEILETFEVKLIEIDDDTPSRFTENHRKKTGVATLFMPSDLASPSPFVHWTQAVMTVYEVDENSLI